MTDRESQMREEYRARYRAEVEDELRAHEPDWRDEAGPKRVQFRAKLRRQLESDLRRKVAALFGPSLDNSAVEAAR